MVLDDLSASLCEPVDVVVGMQGMRFECKVVVVTGASAGMGLAAAELLAAEGAKIVAVGRRQEALDAAAKKIKAAGGHPIATWIVHGAVYLNNCWDTLSLHGCWVYVSEYCDTSGDMQLSIVLGVDIGNLQLECVLVKKYIYTYVYHCALLFQGRLRW